MAKRVLRGAARQSLKLAGDKLHNIAKTKLAPGNMTRWKAGGQQPVNHMAMKVAGGLRQATDLE